MKRIVHLIAALCVGFMAASCSTENPEAVSQMQRPVFGASLTPPVLVDGSNSTWTDGVDTWAGNPECKASGFLLQPNSPAIDAGQFLSGFHCPQAGPAGGQSCVEWYGKAPDAGACEWVTGSMLPSAGISGPAAPSNLHLQ